MFAVCKGKRAKRRIPFRHYTPEVSTKTTIINFAVKQQGLESQLLGIVVQKEQPALERQKSDLTLRVAAGKKKLVDLDEGSAENNGPTRRPRTYEDGHRPESITACALWPN